MPGGGVPSCPAIDRLAESSGDIAVMCCHWLGGHFRETAIKQPFTKTPTRNPREFITYQVCLCQNQLWTVIVSLSRVKGHSCCLSPESPTQHLFKDHFLKHSFLDTIKVCFRCYHGSSESTLALYFMAMFIS